MFCEINCWLTLLRATSGTLAVAVLKNWITFRSMKTFTYYIFINTTPQKLWEALTSPELIRQYWNSFAIRSEWQVGASISLVKPDGTLNWEGRILVYDPYFLLSYIRPFSWSQLPKGNSFESDLEDRAFHGRDDAHHHSRRTHRQIWRTR